MALPVVACQLVVDPLLEAGVEPRQSRARWRLATAAAPAPGEEAEHERTADDTCNRQPPGQDVEAAVRWREQHALAELADEPLLDLALRVAGRDPVPDQRPLPVGERAGGLVERLVAGHAQHLALDLGQRRVLLARRRRPGDEEGRSGSEDEGGRPHERSAVWTLRRRSETV